MKNMEISFEDILNHYNIKNYYIFWYGYTISKEYFDEKGFTKTSFKIENNKIRNDCIYIILEGLRPFYCLYQGCFKIEKIESLDEKHSQCYLQKYETELDCYIHRLVLKSNIIFTFYNTSAKKFFVDNILPQKETRKVPLFTSYDKVDLSFNQLCEIVENQYQDYISALSAVQGIYMIIDTKTGKQYIGSAYGENGIYGRWESYALTYDGGNKEFVKLKNDTELGIECFSDFKYIILEILPFNVSHKEVINKENFYKQRFLTKKFGYNDN